MLFSDRGSVLYQHRLGYLVGGGFAEGGLDDGEGELEGGTGSAGRDDAVGDYHAGIGLVDAATGNEVMLHSGIACGLQAAENPGRPEHQRG